MPVIRAAPVLRAPPVAEHGADGGGGPPDGVPPLKGGAVSQPAELRHEHVGGHEAAHSVPGCKHIRCAAGAVRLVRRDGDDGQVAGHVGHMALVCYGQAAGGDFHIQRAARVPAYLHQ